MKLSSMRTIAGKLALGLVAAGLFSSCGTGNLIPTSTDAEPSVDAVTAAAKTQREFQEYWAAQRQLKESGKPAVAKTAPEPKPEAVVATLPPSEVAPRQTFSQWWADRKAQKAQIEPVAEEEPMVAAPQEAPAAEKKSWSIPQWFGGGKEEGPAEASQDPAPASPVAAAAPEPKEKK